MDIKRTRPIQRGDIYYADLTPVTGSEQGGIRPVLVIQNNVGNHYSPTVIAAAITGYVKRQPHPCTAQGRGLRPLPGLHRPAGAAPDAGQVQAGRIYGQRGRGQDAGSGRRAEHQRGSEGNESLKSAIIHSGDIPMDISADFILPNQRRTPPMTTKELTDNAAFLSAMQMLERMLEQKLLSPAEAEKTRSELKRRLRPTLIFA